RCSQCSGFSQVQPEHIGRPVRCPQCGQAFVAIAPAEAPSKPGGSFWHGLKGVVRSWTNPAPPQNVPEPEADLELHLDGPAAVVPGPEEVVMPPTTAAGLTL